MLLNPKCLIWKALQQNINLTDSNLKDISKNIPLATYCIQCSRRLNNCLEKFCYRNI